MSRNFELLERVNAAGNRPWEISGQAVVAAPARKRVLTLCADAQSPPIPNLIRGEIDRLVHRLFLHNSGGAPKSVLVSEVEYKSNANGIASRAAEVLASYRRGSVCVVDADPARPNLQEYYRVSNEQGLTTLLAAREPIQRVAHLSPDSGVSVITAGPEVPNWHAVMLTEFEGLVTMLESCFDFIIIDGPPLSSAEGVLISRLVDGVVMLVEAGVTHRDSVLGAKRDLERSGARVVGTVLNNRAFPIPQAIYDRL